MGRKPCCEKVGLKKGPWTAEEDKKLINFINTNGQCCWRAIPKLAGLLRCGKSCRLRWTNYLRPDLKRGLLSDLEEKMVIDLHAQLGNKWSKIASHLPGRTDNEIKNHWNTHIKKKLKKMGIDPQTHNPIPIPTDQLNPCPVTEPLPNASVEVEVEVEVEAEAEAEAEVEVEVEVEAEVEAEEVQAITSTDVIEPQTPPNLCVPSSLTPSSSSLSLSSSSSSSNLNLIRFEDFELPDFDWAYNSDNNENGNGFLEDDFGDWDFLADDEDNEEPNFQELWDCGLL